MLNKRFFFIDLRTSKIEGSITMNGKERNISLFRKLSAYIMQDNQLHANLTVEEAMNVAANLKLSQEIQRSEKMSVVCIGFFHGFFIRKSKFMWLSNSGK